MRSSWNIAGINSSPFKSIVNGELLNDGTKKCMGQIPGKQT